jgi:hypothetical protein
LDEVSTTRGSGWVNFHLRVRLGGEPNPQAITRLLETSHCLVPE